MSLTLTFGGYTFAVTPAIRIERRDESGSAPGTRHLWSGEGLLTGATRAALDAAWAELRGALDRTADLTLASGSPPADSLLAAACVDGPRCEHVALLDAAASSEPYALRFEFRFTALEPSPAQPLPGGAVTGRVTRREECGPDGVICGSATGTLVGRALASAVLSLVPSGTLLRRRRWDEDTAAGSLTFEIEWERGAADPAALRSEETLVYETVRNVVVFPVLDRTAPPAIQTVGGPLVTVTQRGFAERADRYPEPPAPLEREHIRTERVSFPAREAGVDGRGGRFRTEWHYDMHLASPRPPRPAGA